MPPTPTTFDPRRQLILFVTPDVLLELLRGNTFVSDPATRLPDDATIINAYYDEERAAYALLLWSASFPVANIPFRDAPPLARPRAASLLIGKLNPGNVTE